MVGEPLPAPAPLVAATVGKELVDAGVTTEEDVTVAAWTGGGDA